MDAPPPGRRAHERIRLQLAVAYRSAGAFLVSYTVNLSRGGLFVETDAPSPEGTELDLRLEIPGYPGEVELRGVVVWIQPTPTPGQPKGMGIQFQDSDAGFNGVIDQLVKQFSGLQVLLCSSDNRMRAQLQRMLGNALAAEYSIQDPKATLQEGASRRFDLVVIHLAQGEDSALRLLERLQRTAAPPAVVALAADPGLRRRASDLGADDVLATPTGSTELRTAALRALGRPLLRRSPEQEDQ